MMRRTASEVIRELQMRVARLERRASTHGGMGVQVCLSGDSFANNVLRTTVNTSQLYPIFSRGQISFKGLAKIEDVSLVSDTNQQNIHGEVAFIKGESIEINLRNIRYQHSPFDMFRGLTNIFVQRITLNNTMVRGTAPDTLNIEGDIVLVCTYKNGSSLPFTLGFTAQAPTTEEFEAAWLELGSI